MPRGTDRYDDTSPCNRCGQVDADCDCAREFEMVNDMLQVLGSSDILVVRDSWIVRAERSVDFS